MMALWALIPRWAQIALVAFIVGGLAGGMAVHSIHKAFSDGQKAMAHRMLDRLDRKVNEATTAVESKAAVVQTETKVKERVVYREVIKRVPQKDPVGCPPIDADTVRLLNAARTARSAEEFMRDAAPIPDAEAAATAAPVNDGAGRTK